MEDLHNDEYSVDMDKLEENSLIDKLNNIFKDRVLYLKNLAECRNRINQQRDDMVKMIKSMV